MSGSIPRSLDRNSDRISLPNCASQSHAKQSERKREHQLAADEHRAMIQQEVQHRRVSCRSISVSNLERANKGWVPAVVENVGFSLPFTKLVDLMNDTRRDRRG
jgi:hypothetical protein